MSEIQFNFMTISLIGLTIIILMICYHSMEDFKRDKFEEKVWSINKTLGHIYVRYKITIRTSIIMLYSMLVYIGYFTIEEADKYIYSIINYMKENVYVTYALVITLVLIIAYISDNILNKKRKKDEIENEKSWKRYMDSYGGEEEYKRLCGLSDRKED